MTIRLSGKRAGDGYLVAIGDRDRYAIRETLSFVVNRNLSDDALIVLVGADRQDVGSLHHRLEHDPEPFLSVVDLHIIHASLLSVNAMFKSEEDFYQRLGFFRENGDMLAANVVQLAAENPPT